MFNFCPERGTTPLLRLVLKEVKGIFAGIQHATLVCNINITCLEKPGVINLLYRNHRRIIYLLHIYIIVNSQELLYHEFPSVLDIDSRLEAILINLSAINIVNR